MPKILGMERRTALLVGAGVVGVVVLYFFLRRNSASAGEEPAPAGDELLPGLGGAMSAAAGSSQDSLATALGNLELKAAQDEQQFRTGQLKRQGELEEAASSYQKSVLDWMKTGKAKDKPGSFKCPSGTAHVDPSTGQIYCRQETSHGFFGDLIGGATGQSSVGGGIGSLLNTYLKIGKVTPQPGGF